MIGNRSGGLGLDASLSKKEAALLKLNALIDADTRAILEAADAAEPAKVASATSRSMSGRKAAPPPPPVEEVQQEEEEEQDGDFDAPPAGIGDAATIRFLRAKNKMLQAEATEARKKLTESTQTMADLRRQLKAAADDKEKVAKQLAQAQAQAEKLARAKEAGTSSSSEQRQKLAELTRELLVAQRAAKSADSDKRAMEVRLHRALEESSKYKSALAKAKDQNREVDGSSRQEIAFLEGQVQRLERQKLELIGAFRKQMKLIDVLRRQKVHVEAARMLQFTEEEFIKTLDWA